MNNNNNNNNRNERFRYDPEIQDNIRGFIHEHNITELHKDKIGNVNSVFTAPIKVSQHKLYRGYADRSIIRLKPIHFFDPDAFSVMLIDQVRTGYYYSVMIKVRFVDTQPRRHFSDSNVNSLFKMAGTQFIYHPIVGEDHLSIWQTFFQRVDKLLNEYNLVSYDISYIQLEFVSADKTLHTRYRVDTSKSKEIRNFINVNLDKNTVVPVSIDPKAYDTKVIQHVENGVIVDVQFRHKDLSYSWRDIMSHSNPKDIIRNMDDGFQLYLVHLNAYYNVIGIKVVNPNRTIKVRFTLSGVLQEEIDDLVMPDGIVKRTINKKNILYLKGDRVLRAEKENSFNPIPGLVSKTRSIENYNIGVIDLEVYEDSDNNYKVYSAGFKTSLSDKCQLYYIDKDYNSEKVVLSLIDELLRTKYSELTFYCHNLSGYDIVFLLKVLTDFNAKCKSDSDKYILKTKFRDDKIIQINIGKLVGKSKYNVVIKDSMVIFNQSLSDLCFDYNTSHVKSVFPYDFAIKGNLFYVGSLPSISYYNISTDEYNELKSGYENCKWCFRTESDKYLELDLLSLYEVLQKANKEIFLRYDFDMTSISTISGLALNLFLTNYYDASKAPIPSIKSNTVYNNVKEGYYGGMTEVYKPFGKNLYYYDVNSLYPFVALNSMPGTRCYKVSFNEPKSIDNLFGFFYCSIDTTNAVNKYIGLLPFRDKGLKFPLGKWYGWYFSEELKFALSKGYQINVIKGYSFNKVDNVFSKYVSSVYKDKVNATNDTQKSIAKSLLNNLLGRFGIALDKHESKLISFKEFRDMLFLRDVKSYHKINEDLYLVNYSPLLNPKLIDDSGLDIIKVLEDHSDRESGVINGTSVVISAAVNAYARIYMNEVKLQILEAGGSLYYMDTDSIVCDIPLPSNLVSRTELGKFKLVYEVREGIFISGKTYCLLLNDGSVEKIAKGVDSKTLSYKDYVCLLAGDTKVLASKTTSSKSYETGSVSIGKEDVSISSESYTRRGKVYNNGSWVNTEPIVINHIDNALVVNDEDLPLTSCNNSSSPVSNPDPQTPAEKGNEGNDKTPETNNVILNSPAPVTKETLRKKKGNLNTEEINDDKSISCLNPIEGGEGNQKSLGNTSPYYKNINTIPFGLQIILVYVLWGLFIWSLFAISLMFSEDSEELLNDLWTSEVINNNHLDGHSPKTLQGENPEYLSLPEITTNQDNTTTETPKYTSWINCKLFLGTVGAYVLSIWRDTRIEVNAGINSGVDDEGDSLSEDNIDGQVSQLETTSPITVGSPNSPSSTEFVGQPISNPEQEREGSDLLISLPNPLVEAEERQTTSTQTNLESFYLNSLISSNPNSEVLLVSFDEAEFIRSIVNHTESSGGGSYDTTKEVNSLASDQVSQNLTESEGSLNSETVKLIKDLRRGSIVSILSPLPTETEQSKENADNAELDRLWNDYVESRVNTEKILERNLRESIKSVVIISKRVNEDDPIPPLPTWINLTSQDVDYHVKSNRLHNMYIGDFKRSNPQTTSTTQDADVFEDGYNLDTLFEPQNPQDFEKGEDSTPNTNHYQTETESKDEFEDGYHLDKLFEDVDTNQTKLPSNQAERDESYGSLLDYYNSSNTSPLPLSSSQEREGEEKPKDSDEPSNNT